MTDETESMADRATKAALDAEKEFKQFLDDLNQYEYMKVYDNEQQVWFICLFWTDNVLFTFCEVWNFCLQLRKVELSQVWTFDKIYKNAFNWQT